MHRSLGLLALITTAAVSLPAVATADSWTTEDGTPGLGRVSTVFPGRDLGVRWRAADVTPGSLSDPQGPPQCVLVDEQRVYAVHRDSAQTSMGRLLAFDRATGVRTWRTPLYPLASLDRVCPVLVGDRIVGPVAGDQSTGEGPLLRAWTVNTGSVEWSQPASVTSSLGTDGTLVFGATTEAEGCAAYAWAAWAATSGQRAWCTDAGSAYQAAPPRVAGPAVIVGHPSGIGLVALDVASGVQRWADTGALGPAAVATRDGLVAYATNDLFGDDGVKVRDAGTGSVAWSRTFPGEVPRGLVIDEARLYVAASLQGPGDTQVRVRALDPADGADAWDAPVDQLPHGGIDMPHVLGERVVVDDLAIDRSTGAAQPGYTAWSLPRRTAFVDGTIYGWTQRSDGTWSVTAVGDTAPPLVSGLAPASGTLSTDQTPKFAFAADDGRGREVAALELLLDGTAHDVTGAAEWTPTTPLADGAHVWRVRAVDGAGNTVTTPARTITVDSTPPSAFAVTAPTGVVTTGWPQIRWEAATDATSGVDHYNVAIDGEVIGTRRPGDCDPACTFIPGPMITDGAHTLEVVAVDGVGLARSSGVLDLRVAAPPRASVLRDPRIVLVGHDVMLDASGSWDNDPGDLSFEWRVDDGQFQAGPALRPVVFDTVGIHTVTVRVTGAGGVSSVSETDVQVRPTPPDGTVGIQLNGGDYATNKRRVTVSVVWRALDETVILAHGNEFRRGQGATTFGLEPTLTWELEGSGARTVFARLAGKPGAGVEDLSDSIVVDPVAPEVGSAVLVSGQVNGRVSPDAVPQRAARTVRVRITASDGRSGVRAYQVTGNRDQPGTAVKVRRTKAFQATIRASVSGRTVWVRVLDAAGNRSPWVRAR